MRADLTKLRQSLFNLLSNAAKFTKNGSVTLIAKRQRREEGDWITLSVSDTGIGIRDDKLEHVFEEFSQADESTSRDFGGTGLGLPISRKFCRMMGGDVSVTSQLGRGSTFTIELPAQVDALEAAKAVSAAERAESREIPQGVHPVLVIDDDPNSRDLLQRMLEAEGYAVATASSGEEGLDLARSLRPSLITLDVLMPGMDGWAVLRQLKADSDLQHTPVIMVSVTSEMDMAYTLGAVEHLTKPVDRDALRRLVGQYAAPIGGGHALVVDDDDSIRSLFRRTLKADGWSVAEATNGAEALDRVAEQRPRIILLDLMMPVMDGFDFLLRYRSLEGCASTPIIVITAKDLGEEDRRRLAGGVERVIEKGGVTREQLLAHVRSLVAKHEAPKRDGAEPVSPGEMDSD
jgi:CheY-like chemotaxis protein